MLIVIQQKGDKWHVVYTLNGKVLSVLHDTWDELLKELSNKETIEKALTSHSNTDNDK
ncbi:hypothetical protein LCGC14_0463760 [marine sediment metagenome]|uniref:Uncharacterized protein n=1 Tax=marine sediment metagenome TaxID=412755 RepID=A0A0F9VN24_9ZZZZ